MLGPAAAPDPLQGDRNLPRRLVVLAVVLSCCVPGVASAQAVVPPGATYVEDGTGRPAATAARWRPPEGDTRVLRVAFADPPADAASFWREAREALDTWSAIPGIPFLFQLVPATGEPDVEFRWVDRFPTSQAGATHRRLDEDGYVDGVTVVLARSHADGSSMSPEFRRLVALHEVGHVLGLPHSEDPGDVMHPGNRNLRVSSRDVRSLRSLYRLDP